MDDLGGLDSWVFADGTPHVDADLNALFADKQIEADADLDALFADKQIEAEDPNFAEDAFYDSDNADDCVLLSDDAQSHISVDDMSDSDEPVPPTQPPARPKPLVFALR